VRYWYDTEFLEDGRTIDLISIGIVAEDGREYYAANSDMPDDRIRQHVWLRDNVWPHLPLRGHKEGLRTVNGRVEVHLAELGQLDTSDTAVKPRWVIANEVRDFLLTAGPAGPEVQPELWAWYCAYDHVVLAQLWGPMIRLPKGIPMWTNDLRSLAFLRGDLDLSVVPHAGAEHNALADARWTRDAHLYLEGGEPR
jgi:hypothetical protein